MLTGWADAGSRGCLAGGGGRSPGHGSPPPRDHRDGPAGTIGRVTQNNPYRLPRHAVPVRYDIHLEPDLDTATFAGSVSIDIDVRESLPELVLNAAELEIHDAAFVPAAGSPLPCTTIDADPDTERVRFVFPETLPTGRGFLNISFDGVLNDKLRGFYRSTYTREDGSEGVLATTQFESTNARRAFPCYDEPDLKAVFSVTLVVDENLTAISCGPVISEESGDDGRRTVKFADTMVLSTYLVAFVVGDLEATEPVDVNGTPMRIVHVPGKGHLTGFAMEAGSFALRFLEDYYGSPYPDRKIDMLAIPDFAFGAMENLGAVTFRETLLLADPATATEAELTRMADVISHELAHMWFGDLVTMRWWNGIWLKEAFATFMEVMTVDAFRPEWRRWDQFGQEKAAAFDTDALGSTRPIEFEVVSPDDAEAMYDVLTYEKGAAVVRMMEQYLTPEVFRRGVRLYLERHAYGNTETTDLWDALEEASGVPVRATMDTWIFQGGHPVVDIGRDGSVVTLTQKRFRYLGSDDTTWSVPVVLRMGSPDGPVEHRVLLDSTRTEIDLGFEPDWIVGNAGAGGFYRVHYQPADFGALVSQASELLTPAERFALVDDTWASVLATQVRTGDFLELARGLCFEIDLGVWRGLAGGLGTFHRLLPADLRPRLGRKVSPLAGAALDIVGYEPAPDEDPLTRELRGLLITVMGNLVEDRAVRSRCHTLVDTYLEDPAAVEPELAAAAVSVVANEGERRYFDLFLERYRNATTPQEEVRFLFALARFPQAELFDRVLEMCLSEVRTQNAPYVLRTCLQHRDLGTRAWDFVERHWDELMKRFPSNSIPRMVGGAAYLSAPETAARVEAFLGSHPVPQGELQVAQTLEKLKVELGLRSRIATELDL